jgi:glycosyltransferase involved in cell wall biosynthesis
VPPENPVTAPVRVARIITRLNVGGPAIQAIEMSARLEAHGCHTLLIHGRLGPGEGDMRYLVPAGHTFDLSAVPALRRELAPAADIAAAARVYQLLRAFRPTIVHTHMAKAGAVGRTAALLYNATAGRHAPARLVHTFHGHVLDGYFSALSARGFTAMERSLARRTDALIAVSPTVRKDLLERYRIGTAARFYVVPLGFDLTRLASLGRDDRSSARAALSLEPDARVAAIVGRLTPIKRPELFIEAAARLAAADTRARFLVVGGGELETALRATVDSRRLSDRVLFLGWRRDVATIYAASDVVVITSRNEGTPVALIESMAAAVPGVSFAVGGVPDVITAPDLGTLVTDGDVTALAGAIQRLFDDAGRRAEIGARARRSVLERFGVDRLADDLSTLYRQLVG